MSTIYLLSHLFPKDHNKNSKLPKILEFFINFKYFIKFFMTRFECRSLSVRKFQIKYFLVKFENDVTNNACHAFLSIIEKYWKYIGYWIKYWFAAAEENKNEDRRRKILENHKSWPKIRFRIRVCIHHFSEF